MSGSLAGDDGVEADGVSVPSRVVPLRLRASRSWNVGFAGATTPELLRINAIVRDVRYEYSRRRLIMTVSSFEGHAITAEIGSAGIPRTVAVDGHRIRDIRISGKSSNGLVAKYGGVVATPISSLSLNIPQGCFRRGEDESGIV